MRRQRVKAQTIFANYLQTVELLTLIFAWKTVIVVCLVIAGGSVGRGSWVRGGHVWIEVALGNMSAAYRFITLT